VLLKSDLDVQQTRLCCGVSDGEKRFNAAAAARPVSTTKIWARNGSPETPTPSKRATRDDRYKTLFIVDGVATFSPTTLCMMTLRVMGLNATLSKNDTMFNVAFLQLCWVSHFKSILMSVVMLSVAKLSVAKLSVAKLSVAKLSVAMLSVAMLNVIMLTVVVRVSTARSHLKAHLHVRFQRPISH
jgi:hypothetical protein